MCAPSRSPSRLCTQLQSRNSFVVETSSGSSDSVPKSKRCHRLGWSHVRPDDPAGLVRRVGGGPDLLGEASALDRHVDALAAPVELPPVVDAAQPALLVSGVVQAGTTVRAVLVDEAYLAVGVPKGDEVLAEKAHPDRTLRLGDLEGQASRRPIPPKQLSDRRAGPRSRKRLVLLSGVHLAPPVFLKKVSANAISRDGDNDVPNTTWGRGRAHLTAVGLPVARNVAEPVPMFNSVISRRRADGR